MFFFFVQQSEIATLHAYVQCRVTQITLFYMNNWLIYDKWRITHSYPHIFLSIDCDILLLMLIHEQDSFLLYFFWCVYMCLWGYCVCEWWATSGLRRNQVELCICICVFVYAIYDDSHDVIFNLSQVFVMSCHVVSLYLRVWMTREKKRRNVNKAAHITPHHHISIVF